MDYGVIGGVIFGQILNPRNIRLREAKSDLSAYASKWAVYFWKANPGFCDKEEGLHFFSSQKFKHTVQVVANVKLKTFWLMLQSILQMDDAKRFEPWMHINNCISSFV